MLLNLRRAVVASAIFFVLLGLAYPLAATGVGQAFLHDRANGSIGPNGSTLIGQKWTGAQWFHGRPDAFDPAATGGSNLGTRSQDLLDTYQKRVAALKKAGITPTPDLVAASGSGVDPDISVDGAYAQVAAVSRARHLPEAQVRQLISLHIHGAQFGFLGSKYVNVLELNEALAALS